MLQICKIHILSLFIKYTIYNDNEWFCKYPSTIHTLSINDFNWTSCSCIPRWLYTRWVWLFIGVLIIVYLKIRYFLPSSAPKHGNTMETIYRSTTLPSTGTHCHTIMTQCPPCCSPTASPSEFRAGGFVAEHVRGHGSPADWPAISAWSLWAPSQSSHAASCWAAHQTAGRGGLQKLSEHWFIFNVVSKVMFGSTTISLLASLGSTPSRSLCRLITLLWLKMDPSWQIAVKWSGTDYTVRSNICHIFSQLDMKCPLPGVREFLVASLYTLY